MKKLYLFITVFLVSAIVLLRGQTSMGNGTLNQCGGQYLDPGGSGNYPDNANYTQTICSPNPGECVTLQFTAFDLESGWDFLYIYDGSSTASPQVAGSPFTGSVNPGQFTASSGCLTLVFTSDGIINQGGWTANVICTPCGSPPPPPPGPVTAGDCSQAVNICTNSSFQIDPNGSGNTVEFTTGTVSNPSTNPQGVNSGCLLSGELNSTWMIVNIASSGTLEFSFGVAQTSNCYDWIMWPYSATACQNIINNTLPPVSCNWNATCTGFTGMANTLPAGGNAGDFQPALNVTCGQQYLICLSNYSSASTQLPMNFFGTAQIACSTFVPILVTSDTICPGSSTTLTASGGTTYSWNTGATTSSITVSPAVTTTYTVTGTGSCGTGTATATVTVLPAGSPGCSCSATASNTGPYCPGQTIQLNCSAADNYSWSGPNGFTSTIQNPTIPGATTAMDGVYTVTVTIAGLTCTATTSVTVGASAITTASNTGPYCPGQTISLSATGTGTFSWSGPLSYTSTAQNPTIAGATTAMSGVYSVTVTNGSCSATATTSVTVSNTGVALTATAVDANCNGTCDGQVSVTATTGTPGYSYSWNTGCTAQTCTNLCSGTYNVTVTDAAGCTGTATVTVNQAGGIVAAITGSTNVSCNGLCDGTATAGVPGSPVTYNYSWNTTPVQTTATATGLCAGTYSCVVSATACTVSGTELVNNGDFSGGNSGFSSSYNFVPPPNIGEGEYYIGTGTDVSTWNGGMFSAGDHTSGTGNLMMVNGSATPNSDVWCQTIAISPNTDYQFSTWVSSLNTGSAAQLQFSINGVPLGAVFSAPAAINTWSQFFSNWNSGINTSANICIVNQNTSLGGNDFALDDISFQACLMPCPDTVSVTITEPAPLTVDAGLNDTVCIGNTFTVNAVTTGGTGAVAITWNPGALVGTTQTFTATATQTLTVNATDANNCQANDSVIITVPADIVLATGGFPATCNNVCDGQVVVLANPTTGPFAIYTYQWSNGSTGASVNGLCDGTYTVTVTDAAGCSDTASATVTEPTAVVVTSSGSTPALCNGSCDGTATVAATGGTPSYNFTWVPAATGANPTTLCAGTYTCTATDNNGCADTIAITISEPSVITASITPVSTICIGQTATLTANGAGGNGGYVYSWTGGTTPASGQTVSASPVVTSGYTVSVTDVNGCTPGTATVTVTVASPLSVTAATSQTVCVGSSVNFTATGAGGNGVYTYAWTPSSSPLSGSPVTVTPSATTIYTVTITDGCGTPPATNTVSVFVNPLPQLAISAQNASGCQPVCADFILNSVPSMSVCAWTFTDGQTATNDSTPNICFNNAGTYGASVIVTDINGCTDSVSANNLVNVYPVPTAEFLFSPQPTTELDPVIYFTDSSYGGNIVDWLWTFGNLGDSSSTSVNPVFTYEGPGVYNVVLQVTTDNGCSDTVIHPVIIDPDFVIYVPNAFTPNGEGVVDNEFFFPKGIGIDTDHYQLWIYDRWGNMIFTTNDWYKGWDGKVMGRENIVQEDVYIWKIKLQTYKGEKKSYVGHVTVVK